MPGTLTCSNHLDRVAVYECTGCDDYLCAACVVAVKASGEPVYQCARCQGLVRALGEASAPGRSPVVEEAPEPGPRAYFARLPALLHYPMQPSVLYALLGLSLFTTVLYWAARNNLSFIIALLALVLAKGLEATIYFHVVHTTAYGDERFEPPDFTTLIDDFIAPLFRYLVAASPLVAALLWFGSQAYGSASAGWLAFATHPTAILSFPGPTVLLIAGLVLLPLLTAIAAIGQSAVNVLNPVIWVRSLRIMGSTYAAAAAAYYAVLALESWSGCPSSPTCSTPSRSRSSRRCCWPPSATCP